MKRDIQGTEPSLSAIFVDYDNIYLSLKRKNEDAAKRFAKDAGVWIKAIEQGTIITPTNSPGTERTRRIVMNRCYGNPVPRRNASDNSTDMNSFPFVRHHFLRSGFEVVDCPPLTAQLKNSSDIRMVMDVRDYLTHDTYFDEFVILSGDADFTPLLHRLRAHARRTVIFANDYTAAPYTAICDGEIRESDLIRLLVEGLLPGQTAPEINEQDAAANDAARENGRREILASVIDSIRAASGPVPIEALADRAVRTLGAEKTSGTNWAGAGTFRGFLTRHLPDDIRLTEQAPYFAFEVKRQAGQAEREPVLELTHEVRAQPDAPVATARPMPAVLPAPAAPPYQEPARADLVQTPAAPVSLQQAMRTQAPPQAPAPITRADGGAGSIQQAIARIYDACQAPPLGPTEYRQLFEIMANEINDNKLSGAQTISNVLAQATDKKLRVSRDDVRFVFDVVSEVDPWFEQGASASLFAGRFRNFVVARCRSQSLNLSADDIDLIDRLFVGGPVAAQPVQRTVMPSQPAQQSNVAREPVRAETGRTDRWWVGDEQRGQHAAAPAALHNQADDHAMQDEDFPRIIRSRLRG